MLSSLSPSNNTSEWGEKKDRKEKGSFAIYKYEIARF